MLGIGVFALGSISGQLNVVLKAMVLLLFIPKFLLYKFRLIEVLLLVTFVLIAFYQIFTQASPTVVTLEISFLINIMLLILIDKLSITNNVGIARAAYVIFLLACIVQVLFFFILTGEGMLLRGDRNHSAVIITLLIFSYSYFFQHSNLTSLIILLNKSRNLLVGIVIFIFRDYVLSLFSKRKFLMFSFLLVSLFFINYLYFFLITYLKITNIGSENNLSRLFVIFDGSNSYRFRLNNEFIAMVLEDWRSYLINTGIYSELIDTMGLYPHNSYLQLIYRVGILRGCMYLFLIILLVKKDNLVLIVALLCQSMFLHDILLSNIILLAFIMSKFNSINKEND
ncbi:hypothetical protein N9H75_04295 [Amylibacter sp.]|nr:hypothetical protein [Amylibacter sp.]